jgi:hypothetical protein
MDPFRTSDTSLPYEQKPGQVRRLYRNIASQNPGRAYMRSSAAKAISRSWRFRRQRRHSLNHFVQPRYKKLRSEKAVLKAGFCVILRASAAPPARELPDASAAAIVDRASGRDLGEIWLPPFWQRYRIRRGNPYETDFCRRAGRRDSGP